MILVDVGRRDERASDSKIIFAAELAALGYKAVVDAATLPNDLQKYQRFEVAPMILNRDDLDIGSVIIIGAEDISDETLSTLRGYGLSPDVAVYALGRFVDHQAQIGARSKLAYALGREPVIFDLTSVQPKPLLPGAISPLMVGAGIAAANRKKPRVSVFLPPEDLELDVTIPVLAELDHHATFTFNVLIAAKGKERLRKSRYGSLSIFGYAELPPLTLAASVDVAVFFGSGVPGERMAAYALQVMRRGGVVVDCTANAAFVASGAPALRGPTEPAGLSSYLEATVLPNRGQISKEVSASDWMSTHSIEALETGLGLLRPDTDDTAQARSPRTIFFPTNGNGLGHAQRCLQIADVLPESADTVFAAFPSCVPMIEDHGHDWTPLVQRSPHHDAPYDNDLVNFLRLRRHLSPDDKVVFDGGFIFESVYRLIMERSLDAVWIRRGLWRPGQVNQTSLDREHAFKQVIAPQEAFGELNADYSFGGHIHRVGPIVQRNELSEDDRQEKRDGLFAKFNSSASKLVVTMLGAGVAADRTAQMQALAAQFDRRDDCLHLILVWPGSSVSPVLFGWRNTQIVRTRKALSLAMAADFVVSAVGYNSFHEALYNGVPAIFVPQVAEYMDDQERRADAASERGLASCVAAKDLLLLEREVNAFLDLGKADDIRTALSSVKLPASGTQDAANIIAKGTVT